MNSLSMEFIFSIFKPDITADQLAEYMIAVTVPLEYL